MSIALSSAGAPRFSQGAIPWRDGVASTLFLAPLHLFYNTVWNTPLAVKYGGTGVCLLLAALIVAGRRSKATVPISWLVWTVLSLILSLHYWKRYGGSDDPTLILFAFSLLVGWASFIVIPRLDIRTFLACLTLSLLLILAQITLQWDTLSNWASRDTFVGTVSYNSYPIFGFVASIMLLLSVYWRREQPILAIVGFILAGYVLLQGQSRGELVAAVSLATFIFAPAASILLLPTIGAAIYLAVQYSGLPIFERVRLGFDAGFEDRTQLIDNSVRLLSRDDVLTLGLGINGFQREYGVELGWYPHNSALESLISGGVLYFLIYLALFVWPLGRGFLRILFEASALTRILWAIPAFAMLISLKSFSIFTNWPLFYFLPLAFLALNSRLSVVVGEGSAAMQSARHPCSPPSLRLGV